RHIPGPATHGCGLGRCTAADAGRRRGAGLWRNATGCWLAALWLIPQEYLVVPQAPLAACRCHAGTVAVGTSPGAERSRLGVRTAASDLVGPSAPRGHFPWPGRC